MAKKKSSPKLTLVRDQAFKLHVSLTETDPVVWRQIVVPGFVTLEALHSVIQLVMGWQMSHLYDFHIGGERYAEPDDYDEKTPKSLASSLTVALKGQKSFTYNYDFGDGWQHKIVIEEILPVDDERNYPICVGGENACPPEDCGGTPGFEELKKTISNPKHPEFRSMMRWVGGYYSPFTFDPNRINRDMLWMTNWSMEPNDQGLYRPFNSEEDVSL